MDSGQTVMALYGAYATGDADQIAGLLHDEVVWTAPAGNATQVALGLGRPEDAGPTGGANDLDREAIVAFKASGAPGAASTGSSCVWRSSAWSASVTDPAPTGQRDGTMRSAGLMWQR